MKFQKFPAFAALILSSLPAFADPIAVDGTHTGGGGDASEARVNEIRVDLLKWISEGGAQGLELSTGVSHAQYRDSMNAVLVQNAVAVAFTPNPVLVAGKEKTCAGSLVEKRLQIDCNIERFAATPPAAQYRLVHHEYAGLAGIEQNDGAASDYRISNQITEYLVPETVLKLAVKPPKSASPISYQSFVGKYARLVATGSNTAVCEPVLDLTISPDGDRFQFNAGSSNRGYGIHEKHEGESGPFIMADNAADLDVAWSLRTSLKDQVLRLINEERNAHRIIGIKVPVALRSKEIASVINLNFTPAGHLQVSKSVPNHRTGQQYYVANCLYSRN